METAIKETPQAVAVGDFWDIPELPGWLKAAFLGFPKSGKTTTAVYLACIVRKRFGITAPIAMFDTESGSAYVTALIKKLTGLDPLVRRARSFDDLVAWGARVQQIGAVGIADSITHPWQELMDTWLVRKNESLRNRGYNSVRRLDFSDIGSVKKEWNGRWTSWFINSPVHLIVCGRAGWEWEHVEDAEGKKELQKTGVKMRTETEFGFEPSLVVEMERSQTLDSLVQKKAKGKDEIRATIMSRQATILGDRFGSMSGMDGKVFQFPSLGDAFKEMDAVEKAFEPHLALYKKGSNPTVNMSNATAVDPDENGDAGWSRERKQRTILSEEIQAELVRAYPGQSAVDKKAKADLLRDAFDTGSWTKIENDLPSEVLRTGLTKIRGILGSAHGGPPSEPKPPTVSEPF